MRLPLEPKQIFEQRRKRLAEVCPGAVVIVGAPPEFIRNGTVHYPFRQDSNLYYLTGFEEPGAVLVFRPGQDPESVLFVREKNLERETWDGFRFGPEATEQHFGVSKSLPLKDLATELPKLLKGADRLYYRHHKNTELDATVNEALLQSRVSMGRTGLGLLPVFDADELLGELRLFKSAVELQHHREACRIAAEAHIEVMRSVRPGISERELHGLFIYQIMKRGAAREGYGTIVAGGANACTLHYVFNDRTLRAGDLLLIDAGAEYNYFTSDITRTYPVNGKFTDAQAEVYEAVLKVQKEVFALIKPGIEFLSLHDFTAERLTDAMLELGLLSGRREDIMKGQLHKKYYPHGVSHYLGMDVHDLGTYMNRKGERRKLEPGMVFTVEPGLYIPDWDDHAAKAYRGIGVRIEDDILVTSQGFENMTALCPKELNDLESIIGTGG